MATLRHPTNIGPRVPSQPRRIRVVAHTAMRDRSYSRAPYVKPRQRAGWLTSMGHALLIARNLLFALWAVAVLAFWLAIAAGILVEFTGVNF
jgi:hypothetical protein